MNNELKEKIAFYIKTNVQGNETGIDGDEEAADEILYFIEHKLLDEELAKARKHLSVISSPEEYWIQQGKILLLKELKEKLHNTNTATED